MFLYGNHFRRVDLVNRKGELKSDRKILSGVVLLALGALFLAYFGIWAAGAVQWSFDIGVQFILACGVVSAAFGVLLLQGGIVRWLRKHKLVRGVSIAVLSLFLLSFVVIQCLIFSQAGRNDSEIHADFVLIPGATVVGDAPSLVLQHRLDAALPYIRANPGAIVIVSGAMGEGETYTEAEVMKQYLVESGISAQRIVMEEQATDTIGNIAYSEEIVESYALGHKPKVMIVTSDYHMFRAMLLARNQEMDAYGITRAVHWSVAPICYCREYFSIVKLFLTGFRAE
jgi:uncharacterized SAM-binding protein YcdF (DUF218 family)